MIKTNNENAMERLTYVAPKMKAFEVDARSAILQDSNEGWGVAGAAGGEGEYVED